MKLLEYVHKIRDPYKKSACKIEVISFKDIPELAELVDSFLESSKKHLLANRCHVIAMLLAQTYPDKIAYVEGYTATRWLTTEILLPVQHAWNKWQNYYFDLSAEVVSKTCFDEYIKLTEACLNELDHQPEHPLKQDTLLFGFHLLHTLKLWD